MSSTPMSSTQQTAADPGGPGPRQDARQDPGAARRLGRAARRARSSPSPARAAAASPRCCTAWPESSAPTRARSSTPAAPRPAAGEAAERAAAYGVRGGVPVRAADPRADRARQRRAAAAARGDRPQGGPRAGGRVAGAVRRTRPGGAAARGDERRPGPTGVAGTGVGDRPEGRLRGRAHRRARLARERGGDDGAGAHGPGVRHGGAADHARRPGRGVRGPRGRSCGTGSSSSEADA